MAESQNPAIPATLWRRYIGLWAKIPLYRPILGMAKSTKTATDIRHGGSLTIQ